MNQLLTTLNKFRGKHVAIIGDLGLDQYVMGPVRRISPEAPVPVVEVEYEKSNLGMSGNLAHNILTLGGHPLVCSVVGQDKEGDLIKDIFKTLGMSSEYLITDASRPTISKLRILCGQHHIVRVDRELCKFLSEPIEQALLTRFESVIKNCDVVVIEDHAKGVVSERICSFVIALSKKWNKKILIDPSSLTPLRTYQGADLIKPNRTEAMALSGQKIDLLRGTPNTLNEAGLAILNSIKASTVIVTDGGNGLLLITANETKRVPTKLKQVFDVVGAGDTVMSVLSLGVASGATLDDICQLANLAAGIVVGKVGCVACEKKELEDQILMSS